MPPSASVPKTNSPGPEGEGYSLRVATTRPDVSLSFSFLLGHLPYFWKKDEACGRVLQDVFLDW